MQVNKIKRTVLIDMRAAFHNKSLSTDIHLWNNNNNFGAKRDSVNVTLDSYSHPVP